MKLVHLLVLSLMIPNALMADSEACFTYHPAEFVVFVEVEDGGNQVWSDTAPIEMFGTWSGGTDEFPVTILFEGLRNSNLEITAWSEPDVGDHTLATGELIPEQEACVEYVRFGSPVFVDGFESGDLSAWSASVGGSL